jgi:chitinase
LFSFVEYPNDPNGVACNEKNAKDTANYLAFVKELRAALNKKFTPVYKLITIAVGTGVFNDEHQTPIKSLDTDWAKFVDFYYLMVHNHIFLKYYINMCVPLDL